MPESKENLATACRLDIEPVSGRTGAIISGVTLSGDLPSEVIEAIRAALVRYKVLFFRAQHQLSDVTVQEAFAKRFGPLQNYTFFTSNSKGGGAVSIKSTKGGNANSWHADMTFLDAYPMASVLYGELIPSGCGDTMWANTAAAYAELPDGLQQLANSLRVFHTNSYSYPSERRDIASQATIDSVPPSAVIECEHPLVRVHPESGERSLVLGTFFSHFAGYDTPDSILLYNIFTRHITRPENTVRWRWTEGDAVMWDNRATLHYGVGDYGEEKRIVRRVTIAGDIPVGVDGRPSLKVPSAR